MLREAMACGTPVITSSLLMAAVKNLALEVKNPDSIDEWKTVLKTSIIDIRRRKILSSKGKKWAKTKTWEKTYDDFLSFLNNQLLL